MPAAIRIRFMRARARARTRRLALAPCGGSRSILHCASISTALDVGKTFALNADSNGRFDHIDAYTINLIWNPEPWENTVTIARLAAPARAGGRALSRLLHTATSLGLLSPARPMADRSVSCNCLWLHPAS